MVSPCASPSGGPRDPCKHTYAVSAETTACRCCCCCCLCLGLILNDKMKGGLSYSRRCSLQFGKFEWTLVVDSLPNASALCWSVDPVLTPCGWR